ncbi:hypothetical protein M899_1841 [Bacteriovorax sp. BSW11_IV]|uniref:hypothetical protein n=1 Tax=Bacteriovorax sp. BSW11_IV TaxID=1353529 RepID=UPI00038A084E|nr:hypothetical protein [Bacteriovorax sp. BSW11_IV]EQC48531.1 hypothetical protein M899_1841 [Bacteriovorax sp. BSW11_IV]
MLGVSLSTFAQKRIIDLINGTVPAMSPAENNPDVLQYREHMEYMRRMHEMSGGRSYTVGSSPKISTLPTGSELSRGINDMVSSPTEVHCPADDRNADLLSAEEHMEEGVQCDIEEGQKYSTKVYRGIKYLIPEGMSFQTYLASCIDLEESDTPENEEKDLTSNEFSFYSNSANVSKMISTLRKNVSMCLSEKNKYICKKSPPLNRKNQTKPTGYCLRYVKLGVKDGGFTDSYPSGIAASKSGTEWKKLGFRNLLENDKYKSMTPYTAPKGAILVYSGGKYGHVEVKASDKEFISDYIGEKPIYDELGLPRKLIGIYVR